MTYYKELPFEIGSTCPIIHLFKNGFKVKGFDKNGCNHECLLPRCWEDLPDNYRKLNTAIKDCQQRVKEYKQLIGQLANTKYYNGVR